ncbi:hypothetical protein TWF730_006947 [Orbilia blumenaviensis]|uniref:Uncharacterized protein n=1 Tax=Orbilia blumenaviensis TaxID=1796055 RepID=A0AAV9VFS1_9PEZI
MQVFKSLLCLKSHPPAAAGGPTAESYHERVSILKSLGFRRDRPVFNLRIWDPPQPVPRSLRASVFTKRSPPSQIDPIETIQENLSPPAPTPSRVSEKDHNVDRNETYVLAHPFVGTSPDELLVFNLGDCHLLTVNHPDYLTISLLDNRNLAELEISISRFSRKVTFNQQNPNETWKREHAFELEELFVDGQVNEIQIWTEQRLTSDNYVWYEYIVRTPRQVVATEIMCFSRSPKVRFLQIFEKSDLPMLKESHIEVSHYNHLEE